MKNFRTENRFHNSLLLSLSTACVIIGMSSSALLAQECVGNSCYTATDQSTPSYSNAKSDCTGQGGHLVVIGSAAENTTVKDFMLGQCQNSAAGYPETWIGLDDIVSEGNFSWVNGESLVYENWKNGTSADGDGDKAEMRNTGLWNDSEESSAAPPKCYVCETEIQWEASSGGSGSAPSDAYDAWAGTAFTCQHTAPATGEMIPGRITATGCAIAKEGVSGGNATGHFTSGYNVLREVGGTDSFGWQGWSGSAPAAAVVGGDNTSGGARYICRVNGVGIGSTTPSGACKIRKLPLTVSPKVHTATSFDILVYIDL